MPSATVDAGRGKLGVGNQEHACSLADEDSPQVALLLPTNHPDKSTDSNPVYLGLCIPNKLPGDADVGGPQTSGWIAKSLKKQELKEEENCKIKVVMKVNGSETQSTQGGMGLN